MFSSGRIVLSYLIGVLVITSATEQGKNVDSVEVLDENNWDRMLTGEWMVEFYAPWCPACKELEPIWRHLGDHKRDLNINVGKIDVMDSPRLSGRFIVTALPTIYHVKDGKFRQYKSPRDTETIFKFIRQKTWTKVEPIPGWKSPTSIQMSVISQFFTLSQVLRGIHNKLMEEFGLPTWGTYLIFALATIIVGALLGLVIVCVIDFIYPPKPHSVASKTQPKSAQKKKQKSSDSEQEKVSEDEELIENIKDDLVDEDGTDSEGHDAKDKKNYEAPAASSPNARKRKARKAD